MALKNGLTVKMIKELIEHANDDAHIIFQNGKEIVHIEICDEVILSSELPIGYCHECGRNVFKEHELNGYFAICPSCSENLFEFEVIPLEEDDEC